MRRLPPLNALKAFEGVARHGSLSRAAEELLVTPTAVGRHVRNLEDTLQAVLFDRDGGSLRLTDAGRRYAKVVSGAFAAIADATDELRQRPGRVRISVRSYTTFLVRWLIPRLAGFQARNPDVEVSLSSGYGPVDFNRERVDVAVRYGHGHWPGFVSVRLFEDEMVVFGQPGTRERLNEEGPASLLNEVLVVHQRRPQDWTDWLHAAGVSGLPRRVVEFDDLALVYQAVTDGLGIGLTQRRYLSADIRVGRLDQVFDTVLRRGRGYYAVSPADVADGPAVRAFLGWIASEAGSA